jgi:outer membrane protein OmpA-like peptidoglycan-associated protein
MHHHHRALTALGLALLCTAAPASAQRWGTVELGGQVYYQFFGDVLELDDRPGAGGLLGFFVLPNLQLVGEINFAPTTGPRSGDITHRPVYARVQYNVPLSDRLRLMLGVGYTNTAYSGDTTDNEFEDGVHALGGLRVYLNPSWSLRFEGVWDRLPSPANQADAATNKDGYNNFAVRAGVSWQWPPNDRCVVNLEPTATSMRVGENRTFRVAARGERSGREWSGARTTFTSSDNAITAEGVYTPTTPGTHTITATTRGRGCNQVATATVTVTRLESIAIEPRTATVDTGGTVQFAVRGRMSDNRDTTGLAVRYTTTCGTVDASGSFRAGAQGGSCTVTATVTTADGRTLTDQATVTVNQPPPPPPPPPPTLLVATVYFDLGRPTLDAEARGVLSGIVDSLRASSGPIHVSGHADTIPPAGVRDAAASRRFNDELSQRRVNSVVAFLVGRGIPRARFQTHAYGFCRPAVPSVSPEDSPQGQRENRRAEVSIQTDPSANLANVCTDGGGSREE